MPDQQSRPISPGKKAVLWVSLCCSILVGAEGVRTSAYRDTGDVATICYGETKGVHLGDKKTKEQCAEMLMARLEKDFGPGVDECLKKKEIPAHRKAAYADFAYNLGLKTFCNSSVVKYELTGDIDKACAAMLPYNKARVYGILTELPGLTRRRKEEQMLCLGDVP